jgi:hypothetical protein
VSSSSTGLALSPFHGTPTPSRGTGSSLRKDQRKSQRTTNESQLTLSPTKRPTGHQRARRDRQFWRGSVFARPHRRVPCWSEHRRGPLLCQPLTSASADRQLWARAGSGFALVRVHAL